MSAYDFYVTRAQASAGEAAAAVLPNVRARCLRAEIAWRAMAARALHNDMARQRLAADKADSQ
jgi:hypothetical protein